MLNGDTRARLFRYSVLGLCLLLTVITLWRWFAPAPALKDGDLIFQTSRSTQSSAIGVASLSLYTHMGIVRYTNAGVVVIEAVGPVKETPLEVWVKRGRFGRYAVYRAPDLTETQTARIFGSARQLYGRPYDIYFSFDRSAIYCSELADIAYRAANLPLGQRQRIGELAMLIGPARGLLERRAHSDPHCRAAGLSGEACLKRVMDRQLITPVSIARDQRLKQVWSNYPF